MNKIIPLIAIVVIILAVAMFFLISQKGTPPTTPSGGIRASSQEKIAENMLLQELGKVSVDTQDIESELSK